MPKEFKPRRTEDNAFSRGSYEHAAAARFKDSHYKRKQMRQSLNLFWNRFSLFKVIFFVHSAGRQTVARSGFSPVASGLENPLLAV